MCRATPIRRFFEPGAPPREIHLRRDDLRAFYDRRVHLDEGEPMQEMGHGFSLIATDAHGLEGERVARLRGMLGATDPAVSNDFILAEAPSLDAEAMRNLLIALVPVWSPLWAAVVSEGNDAERADEAWDRPRDRILHWWNYFGAERLPEVDITGLEAAGGPLVRPLHEGVEVLLTPQWPGEEALRDLQRRYEPAIFAAS